MCINRESLKKWCDFQWCWWSGFPRGLGFMGLTRIYMHFYTLAICVAVITVNIYGRYLFGNLLKYSLTSFIVNFHSI